MLESVYVILDSFGFVDQAMITGGPPPDALFAPSSIESFQELYEQAYYYENGVWKTIGPKPSQWYKIDKVNKTWVVNLEDCKTNQWRLVKRERDTRETAGFPYAGKMIDSDPRSVQRINTAVQAAQAAAAAGAPFTLYWTTQDNTTLWLDVAGMMGMPVALAQYANSLHETARTLRAQIDAATTPEAVEAITWPV